MYVSRKTQLILTNSQRELIDTMIYVRRNLWNKLIEKYNPTIIDKLTHKESRVLPTATELTKWLKSLDFPKVFNRVYSTCAEDYIQAWKMCFKIKQRKKPRFHSIQTSESRVNLSSLEYQKVFDKNKILIPTASNKGKRSDRTMLLCEDLSEFEGLTIPCLSIIKRNNNYYIALTFDVEKEQIDSQSNQIGCDWGLKEFFTTSNNEQYNLPKSLIRQEIRIKNLQKVLSKKSKGSKNRERVRIKLNEAWLRYTNIRKDFIEKLSYKLLSENILIVLEDLDIQEIIQKSHKHRRKNIYKNCFNIFRTRLVQKSERFIGEVIFVDKYFPSSQLCNQCNKKHNMMIDKRMMVCDCGLNIDRDLNAAINILNEGLRTKLIG